MTRKGLPLLQYKELHGPILQRHILIILLKNAKKNVFI